MVEAETWEMTEGPCDLEGVSLQAKEVPKAARLGSTASPEEMEVGGAAGLTAAGAGSLT